MRKDCLVYGVLPHEKRLSGLLGFYPIKKDCLVYCVLPHKKDCLVYCVLPHKKDCLVYWVLPHDMKKTGLLGFTP